MSWRLHEKKFLPHKSLLAFNAHAVLETVMGAFSYWATDNWFSLVQTLGIVGGLWLTASSANREAKAREIQNLLTLSEHHQKLWMEFVGREDLEKIFDPAAGTQPPLATIAEKEYLNSVIVHFQTGWWIARSGGITPLEEIRRDARSFFSLPLPRAVWEETKATRNQQFVRFVENALKSRR